MKNPKDMKISKKTHKRLTEYTRKGEDYSDAISRLLDELEASKK